MELDGALGHETGVARHIWAVRHVQIVVVLKNVDLRDMRDNRARAGVHHQFAFLLKGDTARKTEMRG
ncbi:hypothetical protein D3C72_2306620 [compost metagenome]